MRLVAFIDDERLARKILDHLGLPSRAPPRGRRRRGQLLLPLAIAAADADGIDPPLHSD